MVIPRSVKIYLGGVAAAGVAAVAVVVTAAASGVNMMPGALPTSATQLPSDACDRYAARVAGALGRQPDQVRKALADAREQQLQDAVEAGTLSSQQADAIRAREQNQAGCPGPLDTPKPAGPPTAATRPGAPAAGVGAAVGLREYAKVLGLTAKQLRADLANGQTVQQLAAAKGMDEQAFRAKLAAQVKADLDPQVQAQKITQAQEDQALARIQSGPLPYWDGPPPKAGKPAAAPSPSPTGGG